MWTQNARDWYRGLDPRRKKEMTKAVEAFRQNGPEQRWPRVGTIQGSRLHKMRELRSVGGHQRLLFTYDQGQAVMLHGGDKRGTWNAWYPGAIKKAERVFAEHLRQQGRRPPWERTGTRSGGRTR